MERLEGTKVLRLSAIAVVSGLLGLSISCSRPSQELGVPTVELPRAAEKPAIPMTASHYGRNDGLEGKRTASGEVFRSDGLTAAHKTLPFGTKLEVTNPKNGKRVTVRVNDRGPFVKGRELDLSAKAAEELGVQNKGVAEVVVTPLNKVTAP